MHLENTIISPFFLPKISGVSGRYPGAMTPSDTSREIPVTNIGRPTLTTSASLCGTERSQRSFQIVHAIHPRFKPIAAPAGEICLEDAAVGASCSPFTSAYEFSVQPVEEVDVSRSAERNSGRRSTFEWYPPPTPNLGDDGLSGRLVRVCAVSQCQTLGADQRRTRCRPRNRRYCSRDGTHR